jgi:hypothetical protein
MIALARKSILPELLEARIDALSHMRGEQSLAGLQAHAGYLLRDCSSPLIAPIFWLGCEAFVFGFSAFGLRTSRFDLFCPLAMTVSPVVIRRGLTWLFCRISQR